MKYLAIFIFLSFIGLAVFGFVGMAPDLERGHANCIAVAVNGSATCPESNEFLAFSTFHLSALKKFSSAVFAVAILFSVIASFAVLAAGFILPAISLNGSRIFERSSAKKFNWLISWISLHEASPTVIKGI